MSAYLYQDLVKQLGDEIRRGQRPVGDRMPSIRQLCESRNISKSTVLAAYDRLEAEGLIAARPRSGYFVSSRESHSPQHSLNNALDTPAPSQPEAMPVPVTAGQVMVDIMDKGAAFDLLPAPESQPSAPQREPGNEHLRRCMARAQRRQTAQQQMHYDEPAGLPGLRQQLAQRQAQGGSVLSADELVITGGCQNALMLALMATTERGDVVAVESPGFYGVFQLLELLGLKVLELPSSAEQGLSPEALELALQHWPIKALVVSPCYSTPTGAAMPEAHKERIVQLAQHRQIAIIEDDIYGELCFGLQRPRTLHSYDNSGSVLLCSSFSKSLSRDLRIGWIAPGRYYERVKQLKLITSLASSTTVQEGISYFLAEGGFDRHLRQRRLQLQQQCQQLLALLPEALPMAKTCSRPQGGLSLWLEFAPEVNTFELYPKALAAGIVITPGRLFTAQERYLNALRLSFSSPWTDARRQALRALGTLIAAASDISAP